MAVVYNDNKWAQWHESYNSKVSQSSGAKPSSPSASVDKQEMGNILQGLSKEELQLAAGTPME